MACKRWILTSLSMLAALAVVAGCAAPTTPAPAQPTEAAAQVVNVQYWSNGWFPSSISARQSIVDSFNKEYDGRIHVEYVQGNWDDQATYIQSGAAAGG